MYYFEITYFISGHSFVCLCSTIYEAINVLYDIGITDARAFDVSKVDDYVQYLCSMVNGKTKVVSTSLLNIVVKEGEI